MHCRSARLQPPRKGKKNGGKNQKMLGFLTEKNMKRKGIVFDAEDKTQIYILHFIVSDDAFI